MKQTELKIKIDASADKAIKQIEKACDAARVLHDALEKLKDCTIELSVREVSKPWWKLW